MMRNNTAILNCIEKKLYVCYSDMTFIVDLTEGNLEDSWNSIQISEETLLDINFFWDTDNKPFVNLYGLVKGEDNLYQINTNDEIKISITNVIGTKADYFNLPFNLNCEITYKLYSGRDIILRTKSLNTASDVSAKSRLIDKKTDVFLIAVDKNGATKNVKTETKFEFKYKQQIN